MEPPDHPIDEDAVDLTEDIDLSGPIAKDIEAGIVDGYDLHPLPADFADRHRRSSAVRLDSAVSEDATEPPTFVAEDVCKSIYTTPALSMATLPHNLDRTKDVSTKRQKRYSYIHFAALCWCFFVQGWNDGATGPLLPKMQAYYHINYSIVSMLFVFGCIGFVFGAGMNVWLNDKFGFGKTIVIGSIFPIVAYAIQSPAPPFPLMVFGYFLYGFGDALLSAQVNGFVASMHDAIKINLVQAAYGVGAFASPLAATHFTGSRYWSYYFLLSAGFAVLNIVVQCLIFRFRRQEDVLAEAGLRPMELGEAQNGQNIYRAIFGIKSVHFLAMFAVIYIGVKVTLAGWVVTFIIRERGGGLSSGYISSGFFGGLTVGRLALIWFSKKIGELRAVFLYAILAIALELSIWFVPSIFGNAIAVSLIGMLLGPMYPILVGHASRILPAGLLTGGIGWITGVGVSGSAVLPLITGVLASKFGIRALQPLVVSMMCTMVVVWALIPRAPRQRVEEKLRVLECN